ncbi:MAG TPA: alpha/beta hydrolase [Bryobacteraceae bacterium]|nr:alpha/beta hydrolase [Bryobacteraceae bacterium]
MRFVLFLALSLAAHAALIRDIEYSHPAGESLKLDASIPDGPGPFPAAILVHGGGWVAGDKQTYIIYIFDPLSKANFAWFSINYRLAPKYKFPAAMEDTEAAIKFVKTNAKKYKVDTSRIALIGESAGGHIVSWVGVQKDPASRVNAVVSFYGVHDVISRAVQMGKLEDVNPFFGVDQLTADTAPLLIKGSPVTFVQRGLPPFLMIHGRKDDGVPFEQSVQMCDKLKLLGNSCDLIALDAGHGMDTWEPHPELHFYKQKMIDWLKEKLNYR